MKLILTLMKLKLILNFILKSKSQLYNFKKFLKNKKTNYLAFFLYISCSIFFTSS